MSRYKRKLNKVVRKKRSLIARQMVLRTGGHAGSHHNRDYDVKKGKSRKAKHKGGAVSDDGCSSFFDEGG